MVASSRPANRAGDGLPAIGTETLCPLVAWRSTYITWLSLSWRILSNRTRCRPLRFVVTWKAKRYAVGRIAPKFGVFSPRFLMVHLKTNARNTAMLASVVVSFENGIHEFPVLRRFVMSLSLRPVAAFPCGASFTREVTSGARYRAARPISFQKGFGNTKLFSALGARHHNLGAFIPGASCTSFRLPSLGSAALRAGEVVDGYLRFVTREAKVRSSRFMFATVRTYVLQHSMIIPIGYGLCN